MKLGTFSISLTVKDIKASKLFYEQLGFKEFGGNIKQNWVIMRNATSTIGLFQGMFDQNILTYNPGWDNNTNKKDSFTDVRDLQKELKRKGFTMITEADENTSGPASFVIVDPDGNPILVDQHV